MTYAMNAHTGEIIDTALAALITQAVEILRATFKRFVAASPQTCPPYHSIVVPFQKAEMEITLRPDRAVTNRYRVTVKSLKPNYYGVRPTEKGSVAKIFFLLALMLCRYRDWELTFGCDGMMTWSTSRARIIRNWWCCTPCFFIFATQCPIAILRRLWRNAVSMLTMQH